MSLSRSCLLALAATALVAQAPPAYPTTRKGDVVTDYHGTKVADPYRWLEDDRSAETAAWVEAQNKVTQAYLGAIPERKAIEAHLTQFWNFEKFGAPSKRGKYYTYTYNTGLQNQALLFVTTDLKEKGRVLLDPNGLSNDGTVSLGGTVFSEDGRLMAYSLSKGGADLNIWKVRSVDTGQDLADELPMGRNDVSDWAKDGSGFYYTRYPLPKDRSALTGVFKNQQLCFHKLGAPVTQDAVVYERPDQPDWGFSAHSTDDGKWLVINQSQGTARRNRIFLKDLTKPEAKVEPWLDQYDGSYQVVGNEGNSFYVFTDKGAARGRLVTIERTKPAPADWKTIIAEGPGRDVLGGVHLVAHRFADMLAHQCMSTLQKRDGIFIGNFEIDERQRCAE